MRLLRSIAASICLIVIHAFRRRALSFRPCSLIGDGPPLQGGFSGDYAGGQPWLTRGGGWAVRVLDPQEDHRLLLRHFEVAVVLGDLGIKVGKELSVPIA